jgi:hypothetical protein
MNELNRKKKEEINMSFNQTFEKHESAYKTFRKMFEHDATSAVIDVDKFTDPVFCKENFKAGRELARKIDENKDLHEQIDVNGKQRYAVKLIDVGDNKYAVSNSIYALQVELYEKYVKDIK